MCDVFIMSETDSSRQVKGRQEEKGHFYKGQPEGERGEYVQWAREREMEHA